jgi:uncharacterized phosphosugar-binding protein
MDISRLIFPTAINNLLNKIVELEIENIHKAAILVANSLANDGILYTFGTGHSHVIAEDVAYRAGGLAPVDPILEPSLTGHQHVVKSEFMERVEGIAGVTLEYYGVQERDVLIVISNSGRNAAPIEIADLAREKGIPVIAVTSLSHSRHTTSRHSSGKKLYEIADVVIDNHCPKGDCLIRPNEKYPSIGPGSGIAGMFIIHYIIILTIQELIERGIDPPIFTSGNLDEGYCLNKKYLEHYRGRIKIW